MCGKILAIAAAFCVSAFMAQTAVLAEKYKDQVVGVSDGDTIKVLHDKRAETLRLAQINCPEKSLAFGCEAKQVTSKLVFGKPVLVDPEGRDRYGRTIAEVEMENGQSLNRELVKKGYAWQFLKYSKDADLHSLEQEAKNYHLGIWQAPDAVPPWEFRKAGKRKH